MIGVSRSILGAFVRSDLGVRSLLMKMYPDSVLGVFTGFVSVRMYKGGYYDTVWTWPSDEMLLTQSWSGTLSAGRYRVEYRGAWDASGTYRYGPYSVTHSVLYQVTFKPASGGYRTDYAMWWDFVLTTKSRLQSNVVMTYADYWGEANTTSIPMSSFFDAVHNSPSTMTRISSPIPGLEYYRYWDEFFQFVQALSTKDVNPVVT